MVGKTWTAAGGPACTVRAYNAKDSLLPPQGCLRNSRSGDRVFKETGVLTQVSSDEIGTKELAVEAIKGIGSKYRITFA